MRELEIFLAHPTHGNAFGKQADSLERDPLAGAQRLVHGRGVFRLHADYLDAWVQLFDERADAADQPAAADRDEYGIELAGRLAHDFHADGALSGDHIRIVERMHEHQVAFARDDQRVLIGGIVDLAVQHDLTAQFAHGLHLDRGRGQRHDHHCRNTAMARGQGYALRVIARRSTDDPARRDRRRQVRDLVVGAAQLEGEHRLQVFALELDAIAEAARETRGRLERRFDRNIIDARLEYAL